MAKLTNEQIKKAESVIIQGGSKTYQDRVVELAPFLQLPWDEPTEAEFFDIVHAHPKSAYGEEILRSMCEFVKRRNDALAPKPVDPRKERLMAALAEAYSRNNGAMWTTSQIADIALQVMDCPACDWRKP